MKRHPWQTAALLAPHARSVRAGFQGWTAGFQKARRNWLSTAMRIGISWHKFGTQAITEENKCKSLGPKKRWNARVPARKIAVLQAENSHFRGARGFVIHHRDTEVRSRSTVENSAAVEFRPPRKLRSQGKNAIRRSRRLARN